MEQNQEITVKAVVKAEELDIIKLLSDGERVEDIAQKLAVNKNTLASRLSAARSRLNCKNTHQLIAFCFRNGLIQ